MKQWSELRRRVLVKGVSRRQILRDEDALADVEEDAGAQPACDQAGKRDARIGQDPDSPPHNNSARCKLDRGQNRIVGIAGAGCNHGSDFFFAGFPLRSSPTAGSGSTWTNPKTLPTIRKGLNHVIIRKSAIGSCSHGRLSSDAPSSLPVAAACRRNEDTHFAQSQVLFQQSRPECCKRQSSMQ